MTRKHGRFMNRLPLAADKCPQKEKASAASDIADRNRNAILRGIHGKEKLAEKPESCYPYFTETDSRDIPAERRITDAGYG